MRDNNHRWTVLRADHTFSRVMSAVGMGWDIERNALLDNGLYLSAEPVPSRLSSYFHLYDFARASEDGRPTLVRSFGEVPAQELSSAPLARQRRIAYAGGQTVWAGPPEQAGRGYELELWSVDGTRLRTLRREVPWFRPGSDRGQPRVEGQPPTRAPNQLTWLHADGSGLLYVVAFIPKDTWRPATGATVAERQRVRDATVDFYLEVIDPDAAAVVMTRGPMTYSQLMSAVGDGAFPGTPYGFVREEDPNGLPVVRVFERRLVAQ